MVGMSESGRRSQRTINRKFDKFADRYYDFHKGLTEMLTTMQNKTLHRLIEESKTFTQTNCGWGTYDVASIVRQAASEILYRREFERRRKPI